MKSLIALCNDCGSSNAEYVFQICELFIGQRDKGYS